MLTVLGRDTEGCLADGSKGRRLRAGAHGRAPTWKQSRQTNNARSGAQIELQKVIRAAEINMAGIIIANRADSTRMIYSTCAFGCGPRGSGRWHRELRGAVWRLHVRALHGAWRGAALYAWVAAVEFSLHTHATRLGCMRRG